MQVSTHEGHDCSLPQVPPPSPSLSLSLSTSLTTGWRVLFYSTAHLTRCTQVLRHHFAHVSD